MPLLEDFDEFMGSLYDSFNSYYDVIDKLYAQREKIDGVLEKVQKQLSNAKNSVFRKAVEYAKEEGSKIFVEETKLALQTAQEYDYPAFRERLYGLVNDERLITVRETDEGGQVNFNMNTVAGTLNDYIEGVEFARRINREKSPGKEMPPDAASKIWAEKIYGVDREGTKVTKLFKVPGKKRRKRKDITDRYKGKYKKTIELRLSNLQTQAPFWPIIEYGTDYMPDKGGTAYPTFEGTHFVNRSRIKTQQLFDDYFNTTLARLIENLNYKIRQLENYSDSVSGEIRYVYNLIDELNRPVESKGVVRRIDVAVEVLSDYLIKERGVIEDLAVIEQSLAVERLVAGTEERTYVGGTRVRLIELTREFQERISNYIYEGYDIE